MSLAGVWSENFYQLRNTLGSSGSYKLLRFSTCRSLGKVFGSGKCRVRPITTKAEGRNKKPPNSKPCSIRREIFDETVKTKRLNVNKSELQEFRSIQYCDVQQKIQDDRDSEQLATVFVFDIETTGFSRQNDRIIEFALQDLRGGKNSTFQSLVNPERCVSNAFVHGISTNMVNRPDVPRWKDLVPILLHYVQSRQKPGRPVLWVAHNARRFDVPFFIKEFARCSIEVPLNWRYFDTLPLGRQLEKPDGSKLSSSTLEALREYYGIPLLGSAHRAMSDVNTLSLILQRLTFDLKLPLSGLLERSFTASDITQVAS